MKHITDTTDNKYNLAVKSDTNLWSGCRSDVSSALSSGTMKTQKPSPAVLGPEMHREGDTRALKPTEAFLTTKHLPPH